MALILNKGNGSLFLLGIIAILGFLIYRYKYTANNQIGGFDGETECADREAALIKKGTNAPSGVTSFTDFLEAEAANKTYKYKEWDLANCAQPFHCCDDSSVVKTQGYIPSNSINNQGCNPDKERCVDALPLKCASCPGAFTSPSSSSLNNAGSFSPLSGLYNLKVNANAPAFTDRAIFDNTESDVVQTPCGPVSTFNAYASPMESAAMPRASPDGVQKSNLDFANRPEVVSNIMDNAIPPHMMTQVELVRRAPMGIPEPQPLPVNAVPVESPCNFKSEFTNLASFFRRNTNIFFKDEQQFPICQTSWPMKQDCLNNIMYSTDLSPKENFVVNRI